MNQHPQPSFAIRSGATAASLRCLTILLLLLLTLVFGSSARAALRTWTGNGADNNWGTAANWDTGAPVANDNALFSGGLRVANNNNLSNLILNGLGFNGSGFSLTGNALTNIGGVMDTAGNNTNAIIMTLGAAQSFTNSAVGNTLVFSGNITNNGYTLVIGGDGNIFLNGVVGGANPLSLAGGGITLQGYGTLRLGAANTFVGGLTIDAGTIQIGNGAAIPSGAGKGDVNVASGAALNLNGNNQTINGLYGAGTVDNQAGTGTYTLTVGNNATNSGGNFTGIIQNSSGLVGLAKVTTNVFTFNGSGNYSGPTTVSAGTLLLGANGYIGSSPTITVTPGGVLDVSAVSGGLTLSSIQSLIAGRATNGGPSDIVGDLNNSGGAITIYRPAVAGTFNLNGGLALNGGTLYFDLGSSTTLGAGSNDLIVINGNLGLSGGATVQLNPLSGTYAAGTYMLISNQTAQVSGSAASLTASTPRGITAAFDSSTTPGSLLLNISGTASPATLVWNGTAGANWDVTTSQNWLNGATADYFYNLDNALFNDVGAGTVSLPGGVSPTITVFSNLATNYTISGSGGISGSGTLTINSGGTVTLNTANNYTGDTIVSRGQLVLGAYSTGSYVNNVICYNGVPAASLVLGNGGVFMPDAANSAYTAPFKTLTVNPGGASLAMRARQSNVGTYNFQFVDFARALGGTVDFNSITTRSGSRCGLYFTNTTVVNGIMGGWATMSLNDWVVPSNAGTGTAGYSAYTTTTTPSTWVAANNVSLTASPAAIAAPTTINSLKLVGATTVTINSGQSLALSSGGLLVPNNATGASTITGGSLAGGASADLIVLENSPTMPLVIASAIADNGGATALTKSGQGTLILAGVNTYTGPTYINGATLGGGGASATTISAGTLQIGNGGASGSIDNSSGVTNLGTLAFNRSDAVTFALPISGFGGLKVSSGNITLTANNSYSGLTTILAAGTLQVGAGGTAGSLGNTSAIADGGALVFNRSDAVAYSGVISGLGSLTQQGAGTLTLGGVNTYSGSTTISQGKLALGASASIANSPLILVAAGATFDVSAVTGGFALNGGVVNQVLAGGGTVAGSVTTSSGVRISPATDGVFGTFSFNNNFTMGTGAILSMDVSTTNQDLLMVGGTLALNDGTLLLNVVDTLTNGTYRLMRYGTLSGTPANLTVAGFSQPGQIAQVVGNGGEIDLVVSSFNAASLVWQGDGANNQWDVNLTAEWTNSAGVASLFNQYDNVTFDDTSANLAVKLLGKLTPSLITVNAANNYTFQGAGQLAGGNLTKANTGTLTIVTTNTSPGATVINGGAVQLGDGVNAGALGIGAITDNATLIFNEPDSEAIANDISGTGGLVHQTATTLTLSGNNTYAGGTTIAAGTLQVGNGGSSGAIGAGSVTNNGTLILNRAGTFSVVGAISGTGTLVVNGPGTVTLGGANSYLNNTYISNGVVKLGASAVIPSGGATTGWLILDGGPTVAGTFDLNGFNQTVNGLAGLSGTVLGQIVNNSGSATNTLTVSGAANTTFTGLIKDNSGAGGKVALIKDGASTLTLQPGGLGNTFSGGTTISNGVITGGSSTTANATMLGAGPLTFYGGLLALGGWTGSTTPDYGTFVNPVVLASGASATVYGTCRGGGFAPATVTGPADSSLTFVTRYLRGNFAGNWTGFNGLLVVSNNASSGNNDFRLNTAIGFPNARVYLAAGGGGGAYVYNLVSGTPIIPIGELTGDASAAIALNSGSAGGQPAIWSVGGLNTSAQYDGGITGTHGITKAGTGSWTLTSAANLTYSGPTTVSNGVLVLTASATLPNTATITLAAPGALDVSAAGTLNLGASAAQTLRGDGTLRGSLNVNATGTVAPGFSIGTLTVTNTVTLGGTALMEINDTNTPASDRLVAASIAYGGTLTVTNIGGSLKSGDSFTLFSGAISGTFGATNLPALYPGLSWDLSALGTSGTLTVSGKVIPPVIGQTQPVGTNLVLSGNYPYPGGTYYLLGSTNVALPLAQWTPIATNTFAADGGYTNSVPINPSALDQFYAIRLP